MKKSALIAISLIVLGALPALAIPRTFVSFFGSDANPGSPAQPCRNFAAALALTDAGGEIIVLDSAGYGTLTITKSVSIIAPAGVYAGIYVTSGTGITVSAGAGGVVVLRGLTIAGVGGSTTHGINFTAGKALHVENCVISGFVGANCAGIYSNSTGKLFVKDTISRGNFAGLWVLQGQASVDQTRMEDNSYGLATSGGTTSIRNSVASGNSIHGFSSQNSPSAELNLENCLAANNGSAGVISNNGTLRVSNCTVTGNGYGLSQTGGMLESRGNNTVRGNTSANTGGTITPFSGL